MIENVNRLMLLAPMEGEPINEVFIVVICIYSRTFTCGNEREIDGFSLLPVPTTAKQIELG